MASRERRSDGKERPPRPASVGSRKKLSAAALEVTTTAQPSALVALGASAGGLEALETFFETVAADSGMAYVVVQHLDPNFRSMMDELLARHTKIPIYKVTEGTPIAPNAIYLNPARQDMKIEQGQFRLQPAEKIAGLNLPIDYFFESAAKEYGNRAVGIILSGTGSDGTRGCDAIKQAGGRVFVQAPSTAKFDPMPLSVIGKNLADGVASPQDLAALISTRKTGAPPTRIPARVAEGSDDPTALIFSIIKDRHDIDFTAYKPTTMERRIKRRMEFVGRHNMTDYADQLTVDREEVAKLVKDLLVDVTAFFRDPDAFAALKDKVIEPLVAMMSDSRQIRVWIAGCSSGEEAYSIAIAFAECAREADKSLNLKILATDIHQNSLAVSAAGSYSADSVAAIPAPLLERYFDKTGNNFKIKKNIRSLIVFSQHNILKDPPFTRIDLLTCRNMLIYLDDDAQMQAIALFHFALRKGGTLFLGPSETLGYYSDQFNPIHQKWRIYSKARDTRLAAPASLTPRPFGASSNLKQAGTSRLAGGTTLGGREAARATNNALKELLARYAPPGFLLTRDGMVVHIFGDASKYLSLKSGAFTQRIVELLPPPLSLLVANALSGSSLETFRNFRRSLRHKTEAGDVVKTITLETLSEAEEESEFLLLTIEERPTKLTADEPTAMADEHISLSEDFSDLRRRNEELIADLQSTEENLQSAIRELATSNEELQSANEELMAANEELQSTNEELHSVSAEHQRKIDELVQLSLDMDHLLKATEIGTIFLDDKLLVRRFTPAAEQAFNLIPQDIGRPISHITLRFEGVDFYALLAEVKTTHSMREQEVSIDGRAYFLRLLPYRADGAEKPGIVVTILDIEALKQAQAQLRALDERQRLLLANLHEAILSWDAKTHKVTFCNEAYAAHFGKPKDEIIGVDIAAVMTPTQYEGCLQAMKRLKPKEAENLQFRLEAADGTVRWRVKNISCVANEQNEIVSYIAAGYDISEQMRYVEALRALAEVESPVDEPIETAIRPVLEIGAKFLGLERGVLGEIRDGNFRVVSYFGPPTPEFEPGTVIPADTAICAASLFRDDTAPSPNQPIDQADAPICIGFSVRSAGKPFGTVCFLSNKRPLYGPFTEIQRGFVKLIGQWINLKIEGLNQHQALRKNEAHLKLIFDNVPARIWHLDDQHRILRENAAAAHWVGKPVEDVENALVADVIPYVEDAWFAEDSEIINSGLPRYGITRHQAMGESPPRWTSIDKIPYHDPHTNERSLLVLSTDITSLKEREIELESVNRELSENRRRFEQLYRQTPMMMYSFDSDGHILEASDLWLSKSGYSRLEMIGRRFGDFFDAESRSRALEEVLPALLRDGRCEAIPLRVVTKRRELIEIELSAFVDKQSRRRGMICLAVLVDVTERNRAEKALEQANRELAGANEGLKKFAHVASHDLQEPLRKISQFGDLLLTECRDTIDEDGRMYVDIMRDSAERMRRLIRDILAFSKSVNTALHRRELKLESVIKEALVDLEISIRDSGAVIEIANLPSIMGDPATVQQLFRNLISNSIKYRREGTAPHIVVSASLTGDGHLAVRIKDNGRGFDPKFAEVIFNPFTRLHTASEIDGSGIGLAVCKSVCDRHRWQIGVDSMPDQGSEFTIILPITDLAGENAYV